MCRKVFLAVLVCCLALRAAALPLNTDSLRAALANARQDTDRVKLLIALAWNLPVKDTADKIQYAKEALDVAQRTENARLLMDAYQNLGRLYCYKFKNYSIAIDYFLEYEKMATNTNDTPRQVDALNNLLVAYRQSSAYAQGLACGNRVLQLRLSPENKKGVLTNMAQIYLEVADYPRAMELYAQALKAAEENIVAKGSLADIDDTMGLAMKLFVIGDIYTKMKEYDKAIESYDKANTLINKRPYSLAINLMMSKGAVYESTAKYTQAIASYRDALDAGKSMGKNANEAAIYTALGGLYYKTGVLSLAQQYADSAMHLARLRNEKPGLADVYILLGKLNSGPGTYAAAVAYLKEAVSITGKLGILETEDEALQLLSDAYKAMKRPAEALETYERYISIRDSIYNVDNAKAITRMDVESKYTTVRISDSVKNGQQRALLDAQIQRQRVVNRSQLAGVAALVLFAFFIYRNYAQQKKANVAISKARDEIHQEQQVSEGLLLNILPVEVARELKVKGDVAPQLFDSVTVLFTDFKGFTLLSEKLSPQNLVTEINTCFTAFDGIMQKFGVEKIKTIGDSYMAAGGLPVANNTHPADVVNAALEIQGYMLRHKKQKEAAGELYFEIRIGIHTGPVVAGVVGVKKFAYDIWGDTVNTASRMESSGEVGRVNISGATYALVKDRFSCTYRGEVEAKNKGKMSMYFVAPA